MGNTIALWALAALSILAATYVIFLYNGLVRHRQMVSEGWSGIDVQLKRRADLIPSLVESVKGYMGHEKSVLGDVTRLRADAQAASGAMPEERARIEGALSGALGRMLAIAEGYPDLKASANFLEFQRQLTETEDEIALARRYYNGAVRNNNIAVEVFPANLCAGSLGFAKAQYFEIEDAAERALPKVSLG
jgi:LemA protein